MRRMRTKVWWDALTKEERRDLFNIERSRYGCRLCWERKRRIIAKADAAMRGQS